MTDPTPRPDDELVSAVLDGEATADERALVDGDPAARARLAELAAVRARVAAPVTVPAAAREQAVAAALAAFDTPAADATAPSAAPPLPGPQDQLAARRARRSGSGGRILAVAAAVVVVLFGIGVVLRAVNPPANQTSATSADPAPASPAAGGSGAVQGEDNESVVGDAQPTTTIGPPASTAPTTTGPATAEPSFAADVVGVELGTIGSSRNLRERMLAVLDGRAPGGSDGASPTVPPASLALETSQLVGCASYLDAIDVELDEVLAVGTATLEGRAVLVYAFRIDQAGHPAANGSIRIYAVDPTTCATVSVLTTR